MRKILESLIRNYSGQLSDESINAILDWKNNAAHGFNKLAFYPSRVIFQDFSNLPALIDIATVRQSLNDKFPKCDPTLVNPQCPVDMILDHAINDAVKK